jgi:hypothetical protein
LTPVAESPAESSPPVVASPAIQQTPVVELPAMQQLPCVQLNIQPPSVEKSQKQHLSTPAGDDDYAPYIDEEVDVPLPSDDLNEDEMAPSCAACQLCCDPNSDTDDYPFCMNCNGEAHTICTEQMNFQTPVSDKLVITHLDFSCVGRERYKKTPLAHRHNVVFCLLCKARMIQKKLHPTKKLGAPRKTKKGKVGPSAALLRNLRKIAAYHCQTIIFTMVDKTSEKAKHAAIEEVFYGNVSKNVIGACQQLVDGDHTFANLYNSYEGDDGNERCLHRTYWQRKRKK